MWFDKCPYKYNFDATNEQWHWTTSNATSTTTKKRQLKFLCVCEMAESSTLKMKPWHMKTYYEQKELLNTAPATDKWL